MRYAHVIRNSTTPVNLKTSDDLWLYMEADLTTYATWNKILHCRCKRI